MSGYERENRNVLRRCLKTVSDGAAVTWAGRSFHTAAPEAVNVRLPTPIDVWSVRASDQSRTNAVVVVTACLRREWSRTGNNSVQRHEWLDMLKLPIWWRCVLDGPVFQTQCTFIISSFICQEHIQHNVQEEQIAYGRCDKAEVQH